MEDIAACLVLLYAAHGGMDGGAVSAAGQTEKEINLAITLKLRDFLQSGGYTVVLTRDRDVSIHDASATTIRAMKVSDIHNRLKIMQEHPGCIFLSIHQNHFTESKYSGAQFFYSPNRESSSLLAECLRISVCDLLQPENQRACKACGNEIYLMAHADTTAVLAECGFLSNPQEAALLSEDPYQTQMAFAFYCGILNYCGQTENASENAAA